MSITHPPDIASFASRADEFLSNFEALKNKVFGKGGQAMKQYKHIFDALVNGEQIEHFHNGHWTQPSPKTALVLMSAGESHENFRIKPKTININGHEVPEPVRAPLEVGQEYYLAIPTDPSSKLFMHYRWEGCIVDEKWLSRGLIHLTREAAETHTKALLSFTQLPEGAENA